MLIVVFVLWIFVGIQFGCCENVRMGRANVKNGQQLKLVMIEWFQGQFDAFEGFRRKLN